MARCRFAPRCARATRRPRERQAMLRRPPHILVTTPESLYLLLTSEKSRELLRGVRDGDRRRNPRPGARQARLAPGAVAGTTGSACARSRRCGSACRPRSGRSTRLRGFWSARERVDAAGKPDCAIIDGGHVRELDLGIEVPPSELSAVCSHEQWAEIYARLTELIAAHRSTLIFVNTRRLAERVAHHLSELLGEDAVASHHGSLSREIRQSAEQRLKSGRAARRSSPRPRSKWASTSATSTWSARSARRGRSPRSCSASAAPGTRWARFPRGGCFRSRATSCSNRWPWCGPCGAGSWTRSQIPEQPLDILAQQIVAAVACEEWDEDELFALCRRAWPYRDLSREDFEAIVAHAQRRRRAGHAARGVSASRSDRRPAARAARRPAGRDHLRRRDSGDGPVSRRRRARGHVRRHASTKTSPSRAWRATCFCWATRRGACCTCAAAKCAVRDAEGAPPSIPFWLGEAPGPHAGAVGRSVAIARRAGRRRAPRRPERSASRRRLAARRVRRNATGPPSRRCATSKRNWPPSAWCPRPKRSSSSGSSTSRAACNW